MVDGLRILDDLDYGDVEGISIEDLKKKHPDVYKAHMRMTLDYKYPGGESYRDLI